MCGCNLPNLITNNNPLYLAKTAEKPITEVSPQIGTCPSCHKIINSGFAWCPYCGGALHKRACRYCKQIMQPGEVVCKFCGAPA